MEINHEDGKINKTVVNLGPSLCWREERKMVQYQWHFIGFDWIFENNTFHISM